MIDIDEIVKMWEEDSKLDKIYLDDTSLKQASLHSKYLRYFAESKQILRGLELKLTTLKKNKWLWYNGKMTKAEMDALGWKYDPFNGMNKPLKSEMSIFYEADEDVIKLRAKVEYYETLLEVLQQILEKIKWIHQTIKNTIDFMRFSAGN